MPLDQDVRRIIEQHLRAKGWDVVYRLAVDIEPTPALVEAGINRDNWNIQAQVDPAIQRRLEALLQREGISMDNACDKLLRAIASHEEGHWSICPFDRDYVEEILHGTAQGLKKAGLGEKNVIAYCPDVANMFMDFVDNTANAVCDASFRDGISAFYLNQLRQQCSAGYALFVDSQMKLYGSMHEKPAEPSFWSRILGRRVKTLAETPGFRNMAESHAKYRDFAKDSERLATAVLPRTLVAKAFSQGLDDKDVFVVQQELGIREIWGKKAYAFARVFAPYAQDLAMECSGDGHGRCTFVRRMLDPEGRKDMVRRALEKGRVPGTAGIPYASKWESYEAAYERAAEEIVMNYFNDEEAVSQYDLLHLRTRKLEGERVQGAIAWAKTSFVQTPTAREAWLHRKEVPYQIEEGLNPGRKSLEDVLFVMDTSGSMGWSGDALDGSKYDLALRAVFGAIKGFERLGRACHAKFGLVLFSDKTLFSGWKDYYSLDGFKRLLFTGYQDGGTELNANVMRTALQQSTGRFLTVLISDGDIYNADAPAIINDFISAGNDVVQFSIQGNTPFSNAIKQAGAEIITVDKAEDLAGIILEKVKERYK